MKLAIIGSSGIPSNTANSIQVMKMAQAYAKLGHAVRLYLPQKDTTLGWDEIARHYGLSTAFPISYLPVNRVLRGYDFALRAVWQARNDDVQLMHTRHPQSAAWAADLGVPTIFELHDLPTGMLGPRLLKLFVAGSGARALVLITRALAEALSKKYPQLQQSGLMQIQADGIDIERYQDLPSPAQARERLKLEDNFTLGYTGHLYSGRGKALILQLAAALPAINFLLVGGRPSDVERLRVTIAERDLHNVRLTGFVPNAELALYQAAADVLLMPYQAKVTASSGGDIASYLSPMKMFEYLAAARPILASDLPVFSEVLDGKNAWLLPPGDADAWKKAILELKNKAALRGKYAKVASQTAQNFTWEKRARAILNSISL